MATFSEPDIREMLEHRAAEFAMDPLPAGAILRKARRRKVRNLVLASATTLAVVALVGGLSVGILSDSNRAADSAAGGPTASTRGQLRLVDYSVSAPASDHPHTGNGREITLHDVRKHAECMRSQGFDIPEPTRQPGGGWSVIVDHPKTHGLDFRSRRFRQAWFVNCGSLDVPLSGDLVIGGPRPKVDRFSSCMNSEGYELPAPTKDTSGHYDSDEWQFDLKGTSIDTSTRAWNRAMFVTCAPADI